MKTLKFNIFESIVPMPQIKVHIPLFIESFLTVPRMQPGMHGLGDLTITKQTKETN